MVLKGKKRRGITHWAVVGAVFKTDPVYGCSLGPPSKVTMAGNIDTTSGAAYRTGRSTS